MKEIKPIKRVKYLPVNDADGAFTEKISRLAAKNGRTIPMEARRIFELGLAELEKQATE